jgi:hypothetical protein
MEELNVDFCENEIWCGGKWSAKMNVIGSLVDIFCILFHSTFITFVDLGNRNVEKASEKRCCFELKRNIFTYSIGWDFLLPDKYFTKHLAYFNSKLWQT